MLSTKWQGKFNFSLPLYLFLREAEMKYRTAI